MTYTTTKYDKRRNLFFPTIVLDDHIFVSPKGFVDEIEAASHAQQIFEQGKLAMIAVFKAAEFMEE